MTLRIHEGTTTLAGSKRRERKLTAPRFFVHDENGEIVADFATRLEAENELRRRGQPTDFDKLIEGGL